MKTYSQKKRAIASYLIFTTIVLLIALIFYVKFYYAMRNNGLDFVQAFRHVPLYVTVFLALSVLWFILSVGTLVSNIKVNREFGPNFWRVCVTLMLFVEYGGYALLIVFMLI